MDTTHSHQSAKATYFWTLLFLVVCVALFVSFRVDSTFEKHERSLKNLPFQPIQAIGQSMNIALDKPLVVTVPDSDIGVNLNKVDYINGHILGRYQDKDGHSGILALDNQHLVSLVSNTQSHTSYVSFLIHTLDSGVKRYYLSSFKYDPFQKSLEHVDSKYLGDGLVLHNLAIKGDLMKASISITGSGEKQSVLASIKNNHQLNLLSSIEK